jgi:adenosylhomocysteinase
MPLLDAAPIGDIFVTSTGDINVIDKQHLEKMKDGAMMANSGHFNVEINIPELETMSIGQRRIRPDLDEYSLKNGRRLYLLGEGRLVNLAAAEGHPSEVMDLSFADQALVAEWLWSNPRLPVHVHDVPTEIGDKVASLKLKSMGVEIDVLTDKQTKYLSSWKEGTL